MAAGARPWSVCRGNLGRFVTRSVPAGSCGRCQPCRSIAASAMSGICNGVEDSGTVAASPGEAATRRRRGPSGQELRGPEQRTQCLTVPVPESANPLQTPAIEMENVRHVYDAIAEHWNHTRYKAWPRVEAFIRNLPPSSLVADLGCGNGKNLPAVREARGYAIASDACAPLVRIALESTGAACLVADCLCTPFRGGIFDAVLSIAVLHHLSSEARRVQALREAARLLRPGGQFLVYCWSFEQDDEKSRSRHRFAAQDVLVPWSYRTPGVRRKAQDSQTAGDGAGDGEECAPSSSGTWAATPEVCQRYCHVYREGELIELFAEVPDLEVVDCYFDTGNWCAVARRRADPVETGPPNET